MVEQPEIMALDPPQITVQTTELELPQTIELDPPQLTAECIGPVNTVPSLASSPSRFTSGPADVTSVPAITHNRSIMESFEGDVKANVDTAQVMGPVLNPMKPKTEILKILHSGPGPLLTGVERHTKGDPRADKISSSSTVLNVENKKYITVIEDSEDKNFLKVKVYEDYASGRMSPDSQLSPSNFKVTNQISENNFPRNCSVISLDKWSDTSLGKTCDFFARPTQSSAVCEDVLPKPSHILPPCRVCGDKASGFHYGANTCEACKGFFRRSLKKDALDYKCMKDNDCKIMKGRRNNCPLCRYNKCLAVGMSKEAIKTGRYTHAKRTNDIIEVKQLQNRVKPTGSARDIRSRLSPPHVEVKCEPASPETLNLISIICSAHRVSFPHWHTTLESGELLPRMKKYADSYSLKKEMYGNLSALSEDDFNTFYSMTGLKLDNRHELMENMTKHMEYAVTKFVQYAKAIPGFSSLPIEDQANLIKMSRFEIWTIGAHKFFNADLEVTSGPFGRTFHKEELSKIWGGEFMGSLFEFCRKMQKLDLTVQEIAILKCIVLLFADRCELISRDKVESMQLELFKCLQYLLKSTRKFTHVMDLIIGLRDLTEWHIKLMKDLVLKWPNIQNHPLMLELCSF